MNNEGDYLNFANELKEQYWSRGNIAYRMSIDGRIPNPIGGASGRCSKLTYTVLDPSEITAITQVEGNPDPAISDAKFYLVKNPAGARFPTTVNEFDQGQVAVMISGSPTATPSKFVGQVRFDKVKNKNFISYSVDKEYRRKGYGKEILKKAINKIKKQIKFKEVYAKVMKNNIASIKIFESLSFECYYKNHSYFFKKRIN